MRSSGRSEISDFPQISDLSEISDFPQISAVFGIRPRHIIDDYFHLFYGDFLARVFKLSIIFALIYFFIYMQNKIFENRYVFTI